MLFGARYGTVTDIEIVWVGLAIAGILLTGSNLREAVKDRRFLITEKIRNGRWRIAKDSVRFESTRLVLHLIFFLMGVLAMVSPESNITEKTLLEAIVGIFIRWGFITAAAILVMQSWWARQTRRDLLEGRTDEA